MSMNKFLCVYLFFINLLTFIVFCLDKIKAKSGGWRIPERTLLLLSLSGGFPGGWMAMILGRHKVKDLSFLPFMVFITLAWIIVIIVFLVKLNNI